MVTEENFTHKRKEITNQSVENHKNNSKPLNYDNCQLNHIDFEAVFNGHIMRYRIYTINDISEEFFSKIEDIVKDMDMKKENMPFVIDPVRRGFL